MIDRYDADIPTDTVYDADGNVVASVLPPGDPAIDGPLVTTTGYDDRGAVVAVSGGAKGGYQHTVRADAASAVAYWSLDDVTTGAASPAIIGSTAATPTSSGVRKGVAGGPDEARTAYRVDGTGRITAPLTMPTSNYSLEAWFRTDTTGQTSKGIAGDFASNTGAALALSGSGALALVHQATSITSGVVPVSGRWYHLVATYDGSTIRLYVDGVQQASTSASGSLGAGASAFEIGAYGNGSGMVKADLDEVAVYSAALSGTRISSHFNSGHRVDGVTGLTTRSVYDVLGRLTDTYDPRLVRTHYDLDRLGQATTTIANRIDGTPSDGATADDDVTSTFAYNVTGELTGYCPAAQNVIGGCDPSSGSEVQAWRYTVDAMGRMTVQTPPANTTLTALDVTRWAYETGGHLKETCQATTSASSCTTTGAHRRHAYAYDALGRVTTDNVYSGSSAGTLRGGWTTTYAADGSGRVTSVAFTGTSMWNETTNSALNQGTDTLSYTYVTSGAGRGQLDLLKRGSTTLTDYAYNGDGTLSSRIDTNPVSTGTTYTTTYGYDWAQRSTSVAASSLFSATAATFTYRPDGLIGKRTLPNGETLAFGYDPDKRPTAITLANGDNLTRVYDRAGRVTNDDRTLTGIAGDTGHNPVAYGYDELDRLVTETGLAYGQAYEYDHDGNRTKRVSSGLVPVTTTFAYDRTDELASLTESGTTVPYAYDTSGNLTTEGLTALTGRTFEYDTADRLVRLSPAAGSAATFGFDALGRTKSRTVGVVTDTYGYVGDTGTVFALAGGSSTRLSAFDTAGTRISVKDGTTLGYLVPDLLGSVAATEPGGSTSAASAIRFDGYGRTAAITQPGGTVALDFKFTGALDLSPDASALYDIGARDYSPASGAWTSLDTYAGEAQDPISMNRYLYAFADPTTLIDPSGHRPLAADPNDPASQAEADAQWQQNIRDNYVKQHGGSGSGGGGAGSSGPGPGIDAVGGTMPGSQRWIDAWRNPNLLDERDGCSAATVANLDCTFSEINAMSFEERSAWLKAFQQLYDPQGWVNAIRAVVDAGSATGVDENSWFGTVDARILTNLQDGYVAASSGTVAQGAEGASEWSEAWRAIGERARPDEVNHLIANAEQASIRQGRREARELGKSPTLGESAALLASDSFRVAQRNRGVVRGVATVACGPVCVGGAALGHPLAGPVVDAVVDERDYHLAFSGAFSMFSQNRLPLSNLFPGWLFDAAYN